MVCLTNFLFVLAVSAVLERVGNAENVVSWADFLQDMKNFIIEKYDGIGLASYKGDWKRRYKATAKATGYRVANDVEDSWDSIIKVHLKSASAKASSTSSTIISLSTSSAEPKKMIGDECKSRVIRLYDAVKDEDKWTLSNQTVVNDKMKELVKASIYEHPVHSFIIDCSGLVWVNHFTKEELNEIKTCKVKNLATFPGALSTYVDKYESLKSASDIRKFAFSHYTDAKEEFEKKWIQESFVNTSKLFTYRNQINFNDYSEADLLRKLWLFVYDLYDSSKVG
jgi:hypothetical protein